MAGGNVALDHVVDPLQPLRRNADFFRLGRRQSHFRTCLRHCSR
jgi:hypothetical protein